MQAAIHVKQQANGGITVWTGCRYNIESFFGRRSSSSFFCCKKKNSFASERLLIIIYSMFSVTMWLTPTSGSTMTWRPSSMTSFRKFYRSFWDFCPPLKPIFLKSYICFHFRKNVPFKFLIYNGDIDSTCNFIADQWLVTNSLTI